MDKLVALCRTAGYIFAGSEIYGGLANAWTSVPGRRYKNNIKARLEEVRAGMSHNAGLDCAILMNAQVWVASATSAALTTR